MEIGKKDYKYKAFISYSHKDKAFANWIHKRIENYKIPKSLREKYPNLPKNLKRSLFIDEQELPTSSVLGNDLKSALDNSKKLIVICSPFAVASKWVNEEIRYFKEVHGEFSVLAIIKSGEPKASKNKELDAKNEAFPKSLRYVLGEDGKLTDKETEPLAGDARKGNDKEMALMKLIAGVLGVEFADLWVREKKEARKRKAMKILFVCMLLGAVWFGYQNYTQKIEIQEHGQEYVSLVAELQELKKLVNTAKTAKENISLWQQIEKKNKRLALVKEIDKRNQKIKGLITKKAVEIYQNNKENGARKALDFLNSNEIKKQRTENIRIISEQYIFEARMNILENNYKVGKKLYKKAINIDDSIANTLEYAIFIAEQNDDKKAITLYEKLLEKELSFSLKLDILISLSTLYVKENRFDKAKDILSKAKEESNTFLNNINLEKNSNGIILVFQKQLHISVALADLYQQNNDLEKAKEEYLHQLTIQKTFKKVKSPLYYEENMAHIQNNLAMIYRDSYNYEEAEVAFKDALFIYKKLVTQGERKYLEEVVAVLNNLGISYRHENRLEETKKLYLEALELVKELVKLNPEKNLPALAMTTNNLGILYNQLNKFEEAKKYYFETLKLYGSLYKVNPDVYSSYLAMIHSNLGAFYSDLNQFKEAEKFHIQALQRYKSLSDVNLVYLENVFNILYSLITLYEKNSNQSDKIERILLNTLKFYRNLSIDNIEVSNKYIGIILKNLVMTSWNLFREYMELSKFDKGRESFIKMSDRYEDALAFYIENLEIDYQGYGLDYAELIIFGVQHLDQPIENLNVAKEIIEELKEYSDIEYLLVRIENLEKNN